MFDVSYPAVTREHYLLALSLYIYIYLPCSEIKEHLNTYLKVIFVKNGKLI